MNKAITTSQTSLDLFFSSVTDIVRFSVQKKRYECAVIVREEMKKVREGIFRANANECAMITRHLNRYKTKLKISWLSKCWKTRLRKATR